MRIVTFLFLFFSLSGLAADETEKSGFVQRNRPYDVQHYDITLTVNPKQVKDRFESAVVIQLTAKEALETIELDSEDILVQRAFWNGTPVPHKTKSALLELRLPASIEKGQRGELRIHYVGKVNTEQAGLFKVTDPDAPERGTLLFTQLEAISARRFFPCNDEPADKATMEVGAIVPQGIDVISSGVVVSNKVVEKSPGKWHEVKWGLKQPHSTYLANIAIGSFAKDEKLVRHIPVSVYAAKNALPKAAYVLDTNMKALEFLEKYLHTPYPWPKYASVGLPTFAWGGMENTSNTFLNQDRMLLHDPKAEEEKLHIAMLTAHELGHQWFGDLVTMRWWDDIWLNEAFASFAAYKASEALFSKEQMAVLGVQHLWTDYFRQEDGPRSHPIVRKDLKSPDDAFDGISYTKGEQVLRMLEFYLGEEKFRRAMGKYLKKYAYANANYTEFFEVMQESTGKDLTSFRDSWLLQRGYPVVSYRTAWDESDKELKVTFQQQSNHAGEKAAFSFRMPVVFHRRSEPEFHQELTVEFSAARAQTDILAALPAEPEWITLNPEGVILARISAEDSATNVPTLMLQAEYDPDSVARVWALNELARPLTLGKPIGKEAEATLAKALLTEKSPFVRIGLLTSFEKLPAKSLPALLSRAFIEASETAGKFVQTANASPNELHGWELWRTRLLRQLPKANDPTVFKLVSRSLRNPAATLDEVASGAYAMASLGDKQSLAQLKQAMTIQGKRGYRYRYWVQYAMAAIPSESAVVEIKKLASSATADLMGKIPGVVRDNPKLKTSKRWASFLEEFLTKDKKHGGVVKLRMLNTIEDVKNDAVKQMLQNLAKKSPDAQIKESAERILSKNFPKNG
jgi:hypothetical protein